MRARNLVAVLMIAVMFACMASARATSPLSVGKVLLATDDGYFIGHNCYTSAWKLDAIAIDANGGGFHCGYWVQDTAPPYVHGGIVMPNFYAVGLPFVPTCRFLSLTVAGAIGEFSVLEVECRTPQQTGGESLYADGFEARADR